MPVGDSITCGYTDNPTWSVPFNYGWRGGLFRLLNARRRGRFTFVGASPEPWNNGFGDPLSNPRTSQFLRLIGQDNHRGYGGIGTAGILSGISSWMAADQPDVVLLMIGINDFTGGASAEPTDTESNLSAIVQAIYAANPDAHVVVSQIFSSATDTPAIRLYNTFIRNTLVPTFRAAGKSIDTVDQSASLLNGAAISASSMFANGSNHPIASGYDRMALALFRVLARRVDMRFDDCSDRPGTRLGMTIGTGSG